MNKRYFLALVNIVLLVFLTLFAWDRYLLLEHYYSKWRIDFDLINLIKALKNDILILTVGILSLIGILFFPNKKTFFSITSFYSAILLFLLCFVRSFGLLQVILAICEIIFIWLLFWEDSYTVFRGRRITKFWFLLAGIGIYMLLRLIW